jgi:hypothetical protein
MTVVIRSLRRMLAALTVLVALVVASLGPACADLTLVSRQTASMPGAAAESTEQTLWLGKDRMRQDSGTNSILVRLDQKKLYLVDHGKKQYSVISLPVDLKQLLPAELAGMAEELRKAAQVQVVVEPTNDKQTVGSWPAQLYRVTASSVMGKITSQAWLTQAIAIDSNLFQQLMNTIADLLPEAKLASELAKLKGYPVLVENSFEMMGQSFQSREELVSASDKPAPAGTYELPPQYTAKPFNLIEMQPDP